MSEPVLVRDGHRLEINAGQTAYVWAGGIVVAHGGRVTVGSGGLCLSDGDTVVSLVDDGVQEILPRTAAPVAVMRRGRVNPETGTAYVTSTSRYHARGSAHVSRAPGATGGVTDGRLVEFSRITNDTFDQTWAEAYQQWTSPNPAQEHQRPRTEMAAEPGPDAVAWLAQLVDRLVQHGATRLATEKPWSRTMLRVSTPDPLASTLALYAEIAVPPTVMIYPYAPEPPPFIVALETSYGAAIEIVTSTPTTTNVDTEIKDRS